MLGAVGAFLAKLVNVTVDLQFLSRVVSQGDQLLVGCIN